MSCSASGYHPRSQFRKHSDKSRGVPRVAFLECDSGQPDFTMPGMLSLHLIEAPLSGMMQASVKRDASC